MNIIALLVTLLFSTQHYTDAPCLPRNIQRVEIQLFPDVAAYIEKQKTIHCLATMVYGEARSESIKGQIAVAYTVKNRVKGNVGICNEVLRPYQYSVFNGNTKLQTIARNPHMQPPQTNATDAVSWEDAKQVATSVYNSTTADPTKGATHYISWSVMRAKRYATPLWAKQYRQVAIIERHQFYRKG